MSGSTWSCAERALFDERYSLMVQRSLSVTNCYASVQTKKRKVALKEALTPYSYPYSAAETCVALFEGPSRRMTSSR